MLICHGLTWTTVFHHNRSWGHWQSWEIIIDSLEKVTTLYGSWKKWNKIQQKQNNKQQYNKQKHKTRSPITAKEIKRARKKTNNRTPKKRHVFSLKKKKETSNRSHGLLGSRFFLLLYCAHCDDSSASNQTKGTCQNNNKTTPIVPTTNKQSIKPTKVVFSDDRHNLHGRFDHWRSGRSTNGFVWRHYGMVNSGRRSISSLAHTIRTCGLKTSPRTNYAICMIHGSEYVFFCWRLLGLIPGGALFSQLSNGEETLQSKAPVK